MNHRFFNEDEKRERAVRVENLKAAYANPEKLRAGGKVNTSAIDGNGVYSTHGKD